MGWSVTVEDFGRIERAEIDVRPLMLFVGDNNSGKSYLASLLWGIVAMQGDVDLKASPKYPECLSWVAERLGPGKPPVNHILSGEEARLFATLFEDAFARGAAGMVERIFNAPVPRAKSVGFRAIAPRPLRLTWTLDAVHSGHMWSIGDGTLECGGSRRTSLDELHALMATMLARVSTLGRLTRPAVPFSDGFQTLDPIFMPASRTGFMLLYKSAVGASMRRELRGAAGSGVISDLTTPAFHFLDMLVQGFAHGPVDRQTPTRFAEEAEMMEREIGGRVEALSSLPGMQDYRYRMAGAQNSLTMSRSSSLVTETAPILLVLRHLEGFKLLVLEEPEAHLHPRLQRVLARVVARLVNKGVYVWITTHSTTFCQQINNLVKLGSMPEDRAVDARAKWGYGDTEALKLDDVAGYQLIVKEETERTEVTELRKTERGLVMPSFNRELVRLGEEIDDLDRSFEEDAS